MIFFLLYVNAKRNTYRNRNHSGSHTCQCRSDASKSTQQVEIRNRKCMVCFPFLPLSSLSFSLSHLRNGRAHHVHQSFSSYYFRVLLLCLNFFGRFFFCFYLCYNFYVSSLKALFFDVFFFLSYICSLNRLEWGRRRRQRWWRATLITELRAHAFHFVILFYSLFHAPLCHTFWYRTECFTFDFAPKI